MTKILSQLQLELEKESPGLHLKVAVQTAAEAEMGRVSRDCEQGPTSAQHCDLTPRSVR